MKSLRIKVLQSVLVYLVLGLAQSTGICAEVKLISADPNAGDWFGWSVHLH